MLNAQDWTPVFSEVMSRNRFEEITEALHFQDNEEAHKNQWDNKDNKKKYDPFYKIRKFWKKAFEGFLEGFIPSKNVNLWHCIRTKQQN